MKQETVKDRKQSKTWGNVLKWFTLNDIPCSIAPVSKTYSRIGNLAALWSKTVII